VGAVEDVAGGRAGAKESEHQVVTATIRLRQYPACRRRPAAVAQWGDVWTVEHVVRGVNEMVLEVTRPRWTAGGGTAG
jgi:hypothetical protein